MVVLATSQEWLQQSALLLEARPKTTIVTTKYRISKPSTKSKSRRLRKTDASKDGKEDAVTAAPTTTDAQAPTAALTFKTWCPENGVTLKYETNKAAEVGRLFMNLGRLGRGMVGLGNVLEEEPNTLDVPGSVDELSRAQSPAPPTTDAKGSTAQADATKTQGGGGAKKKKKGKK